MDEEAFNTILRAKHASYECYRDDHNHYVRSYVHVLFHPNLATPHVHLYSNSMTLNDKERQLLMEEFLTGGSLHGRGSV